MQSTADRIATLDSLITGFAIPIFRREDPATGRMLNGLGPDDYRRVLDGYGCPDCLAQFKTYLAACPLCGWQRDLAKDIQTAPDYWTQHLKDRADPSFGVTFPKQEMIEQALKDIHNDPDVEHTTMSKLKPKRRDKAAQKLPSSWPSTS